MSAEPLDAHRARKQAIRNAARIWRAGCDDMDRLTVAAAVEACYSPGGPDRAELARLIRVDRARRAEHRAAA
ncbi:hypothetical protein ACFV2U_21140 [Streptomyces sp. NPDC059697]|uniref:hypothetical protein n=1 Tax=Streptomyces sp. NPDC059697 TaxID=3346912 RepID=UPI003696AA97